MIGSAYRIQYKYGDIIKIKPIFDAHLGSTNCDLGSFREYLKNSDDNTYFFGGGDLLDMIITSDIKRYTKHNDAITGHAIVDQQIEKMVEILAPYKSRLMGIGSGNHEANILKRCGTDPTDRMCKTLQVKNLGYSGLLKLILREGDNRSRTVIIRYHHGWGGGSRTQGGDLTKFSKDLLSWDADVFLYGHVHRKQSDRVPRIGLSGVKFINRSMLIGICGTFLKTYGNSDLASYGEIKGYPPTEIGGITLNIKPQRRWVDMWIDV